MNARRKKMMFVETVDVADAAAVVDFLEVVVENLENKPQVLGGVS